MIFPRRCETFPFFFLWAQELGDPLFFSLFFFERGGWTAWGFLLLEQLMKMSLRSLFFFGWRRRGIFRLFPISIQNPKPRIDMLCWPHLIPFEFWRTYFLYIEYKAANSSSSSVGRGYSSSITTAITHSYSDSNRLMKPIDGRYCTLSTPFFGGFFYFLIHLRVLSSYRTKIKSNQIFGRFIFSIPSPSASERPLIVSIIIVCSAVV